MSNRPKEEIASAVGEAVQKFLNSHMGECAEEIFAQVVDDAIIVRLKGVFPPAETDLCHNDKGIKLIKELKEKLIERAKPLLKVMIEGLAEAKVLDIHSSFNPHTGEHVEVFILDRKL